MRLIGLAVALALSLVLAPLAAEAQQARRVYKIGYLAVVTRLTLANQPGVTEVKLWGSYEKFSVRRAPEEGKR